MDKRMSDEDFVEYKKRLREQNKIIDEYLKGVMFWPSHISGTFYRHRDPPKMVNKRFTI